MNQVSTTDRYVNAASAPLDGMRRATLGVVTRSERITRVIARRDVRVPVLATAQIALFFAVTVTRPLWLFVLGPLVLGIPHLASDLRYLVLRQHIAREVIFVACAATALFLGIRTLDLFHAAPSHWAGLEVGVGVAWVSVAIASGAHERKSRAPLLVLPLLLALGAFAVFHAGIFRVVLAHAHNFIGVLAWIVMFRKNKRAVILPVLALAAALALILSGVMLPFTLQQGFSSFGIDLLRVGRALAPGASPQFAAAVVLSFVLMQSVHYATWLVWIPQDNLPGEGTFTFRMSARSLVADFGVVALVIFGALAALLLGAAAFNARNAVSTYMSLATFHGYFEIAILAYFAARGRLRIKSDS